MFCSECGKEIKENQKFCTECGATNVEYQPEQPVAPEAPPAPPAQVPPSPPPPRAAPPPVAPAPQVAPPPLTPPPLAPPPAAAPAVPPKSRKGLLAAAISAAAVLVIVAIVLILTLVVFEGEGPEDVMKKFFKCEENLDLNGVMMLLDKSYFGGQPEIETIFRENYYKGTSNMKVTGIKYQTSVSGDTATVDVVGGTENYTRDGKQETEDYSKDKWTFDLVKKDGKWLISPSSFPNTIAFGLLQNADAAYDSFLKKLDELQVDFNGLIDFYNSSPYLPNPQAYIDRANGVLPKVGPLKDEGQKAMEGYQKVMNLRGRENEDFKEASRLSMDVIKNYVGMIDTRVDMTNYIKQIASSYAAKNPLDFNTYNAKVRELDARVKELQQKGTQLVEERNKLSKK